MFHPLLIHFIVACFSGILVFVASLTTNLLLTSFVRFCLAFVAGWVLTYVFRFLWQLASRDVGEEEAGEESEPLEDRQAAKPEEKQTVEEIDTEQASQMIKDLLRSE
ncbi:hypothetical protein M3212_01580 [Alkalihalobacillus oceani]|uniref:hypothetical protein n=1 Tax=Halalkalibacter oceani TaxID=1653776 RepID=UPI00203B2BEF|nr:hypothetical protein [Halalkalibacter oceani]MCM3759471.1 hypothetical protein [Halalkalibacter oceani]